MRKKASSNKMKIRKIYNQRGGSLEKEDGCDLLSSYSILPNSGTHKGPQNFVPLSESPSYLDLHLCGTEKKMPFLTRDFTNQKLVEENKRVTRRGKNFYRHGNQCFVSCDLCLQLIQFERVYFGILFFAAAEAQELPLSTYLSIFYFD